MKKQFLLLIILISFTKSIYAQAFDNTVYSYLRKAEKDEFITYAKSVRLTTVIDTLSESLFAKTKGCLYMKPLGSKNNNDFFDLVLIVSTLNKENNKLILKNAVEDPNKKGTWSDAKYVYMEWDTENPVTKEMWYKVLVYKKKK